MSDNIYEYGRTVNPSYREQVGGGVFTYPPPYNQQQQQQQLPPFTFEVHNKTNNQDETFNLKCMNTVTAKNIFSGYYDATPIHSFMHTDIDIDHICVFILRRPHEETIQFDSIIEPVKGSTVLFQAIGQYKGSDYQYDAVRKLYSRSTVNKNDNTSFIGILLYRPLPYHSNYSNMAPPSYHVYRVVLDESVFNNVRDTFNPLLFMNEQTGLTTNILYRYIQLLQKDMQDMRAYIIQLEIEKRTAPVTASLIRSFVTSEGDPSQFHTPTTTAVHGKSIIEYKNQDNVSITTTKRKETPNDDTNRICGIHVGSENEESNPPSTTTKRRKQTD